MNLQRYYGHICSYPDFRYIAPNDAGTPYGYYEVVLASEAEAEIARLRELVNRAWELSLYKPDLYQDEWNNWLLEAEEALGGEE